MQKLSKKAILGITLGSLLAVAAVAVPVGVIYGAPTVQSAPSDLVRIDRTKSSQRVEWGTEPSSIDPPALTTDETDYVALYGPGKFVSSSLTEASVPGASGVTATFSYKPKSTKLPTLQITYSLEIVKAVPAKAWSAEPLLLNEKDGWPAVKGSPLQQPFSENKASELLKSAGYTGYHFDGALIHYYADLQATTELTEEAYGALKRDDTFYGIVGVALDTKRYLESWTGVDQNAQLVSFSYPASGSLKIKFNVHETAFISETTELIRVGHYQHTTFAQAAYPQELATGYKFEKWIDMVITAQNSPIKDANSPPVGLRIYTFYDLRYLNAGTEFDLRYLYGPAPGYVGEKVIFTLKFITDPKIEDGADPYWADRDQQEVNTTDYRQGDDPTAAASLAPFDTKLYLDHIDYYVGQNANGSPVSAAEIASLSKDQTFSAVLFYKLTPNFTFSGSTSRTYVKVTRHFRVAPSIFKVDRTIRSIKTLWPTDPKTVVVPELTSDIFAKFGDYGPGSLLRSTITSATEPADRAGTITFSYPAKSGSGATVEVTYSVDIGKLTPTKTWPADILSIPIQEITVEKGSQFPVQVNAEADNVEKYLSLNGYVGYLVDYKASRYTSDEQGTNETTLAQYAQLEAEATVYGRFVIYLDTAHYVDSSTVGQTTTNFVKKGILRVQYKLKSLAKNQLVI